MILDYHEQLAGRVRDAIRAAFDAQLDQVSFQYPRTSALGDLASAAPFELARSLKRKPREIAEQLAAALQSVPGVQRVDVAGAGYVNLFLERAPFAARLVEALREPRAPQQLPGLVIVEHTSINPNKAAHIGHLRNAVLGDTLVRVLRARGHHVVVQNYIDDTGVQVADVVVGFLHLEKKTRAEVAAIHDKFDYYCWDLYAKVGEFYAKDPANKALQAQVLHAIEAGDSEVASLADDIARRIVECHLRTMARLGIHYDLVAHESDVLHLHFWDRAFKLLQESGAIRFEAEGKAKGCWVLAMEGDSDDEDKILVRSNGTVTYTGKDIAYQLWKLGKLGQDFYYRREELAGQPVWVTSSTPGDSGAPVFGHARDVYNVIDVGQSYPQRVVRAGVAALGHAEGAEHSHHLGYEKVVLSPATARALGYEVSEEQAVKVSGRKGLGVKADDLLDALVTKALREIDTRDEGATRDSAEKVRSARAIAVGALRYFLVRYGRNKVIVFDMDEALAFTGETGPYLQNSVVRARSILARLSGAGHGLATIRAATAAIDWKAFLATAEGAEVWDLFALMARTDEVCEAVVRSQEVALLARHTFAVAQAFHGYYQNPAHTVLHAASEVERMARANVVDLFVAQMDWLLERLGIPLPEKM